MSDTTCKCGLVHPGALYNKRGLIYSSVTDHERTKHFYRLNSRSSCVRYAKIQKKAQEHPLLIAIYKAAKGVDIMDPSSFSELERVIHDFECFKAKGEQQ